MVKRCLKDVQIGAFVKRLYVEPSLNNIESSTFYGTVFKRGGALFECQEGRGLVRVSVIEKSGAIEW